MPTATFYTHVAKRNEFICRLSQRAVGQGGQVLLWLDDEETLARLDADLWRIPLTGFLPHELWTTGSAWPQDVPLILAAGWELPRLPEKMVVLNASENFWCDAPVQPQRVLEIVGDSLEDLAAARERFRAYKQKGFEIEHHTMQGKA